MRELSIDADAHGPRMLFVCPWPSKPIMAKPLIPPELLDPIVAYFRPRRVRAGKTRIGASVGLLGPCLTLHGPRESSFMKGDDRELSRDRRLVALRWVVVAIEDFALPACVSTPVICHASAEAPDKPGYLKLRQAMAIIGRLVGCLRGHIPPEIGP